MGDEVDEDNNSELDEDDGKVCLFFLIRNKNGISKKATLYFRLWMPRMLASSEGWATMAIYR